MKDRIKKIQEYSGLSLGVFASRTGIKAASLSHILNGRNNPSLDVVMKIHETFPEISWEWMLYGTGTMLNGGNVDNVDNKPVESNIAPSPNQTNRTIFDNDSVKEEEFEDEPELDDDTDDVGDDNIVDIDVPKTVERAPSNLSETIENQQKSESEIIDSFLKSDSFKNILDTHLKAKEKSVKKIIVLYDDETYAEYSLNKL
ncbi:MAG: helix-turn-helix transcriptional regulator [Bacteroidales bacterium]|jgi:transcriptional regulator with XRE-family HTH domain|nr:helix-turn-helix transcriptional regulator [Bacteroidales bacterium]